MTSPDAPRVAGLPPGPALPLVALVLSLVGLCVPPLLLLTLALGGYAVLRARRDPTWKARRPLAQGALFVSATGLVIFALLVIPNLHRFRLRAKQAECRGRLFELYGAQTRLHASRGRYTESLAELDVRPAPGRYLYRLAAEGPAWTGGDPAPEQTAIGSAPALGPALGDALERQGVPSLLRETLGVKGACPGCTVTMLCVANLDGDDTLDVWTISSTERPDGQGGKIGPGVVWNHVDDTAR